MSIDRIDRDILYALDFHARDSLAEIARRLRMSKDTLNYRIKRLEQSGLIKGYYVVPDTTKLGLSSYKIMLKYQGVSLQAEQELLAYLEESAEVGWIAKTDGYYDLMFIVWVQDESALDGFASEFLERFSDFFYLRDIAIITQNHAYQRSYLSQKGDAERSEVYYEGKPNCICDGTDLKMISILSTQARQPTVEMASVLDLTPEAVSYRIKKLEKNGVIGAFRPRLDLGKLGYLYYNVIFRLKKTSVIPRLIAYARHNPNITYAVTYLGAYDLGFDIEVESQEQFRSTMNELMEHFGYGIVNYNHVTIYKELKITY